MKRFILASSLTILGLVGIGCSGSSSPGLNIAPDPVVRFINASPGSTALDFFLNDTVVGNNVPYKGSSPTFVSFEPGEYDARVEENGDPETQWIETLGLSRDNNIVVFGVGLVTPPNTDLIKRLRPVAAQFDRTAPNGNRARLIIVNGYNRADGLDNPSIDLQNPGDTPANASRNIAFAAAAVLNIDSGSQTFLARRSGTEFDITPPTTFDFGAGKIYAAVVSGIEDDVTNPPTVTFIELQTR